MRFGACGQTCRSSFGRCGTVQSAPAQAGSEKKPSFGSNARRMPCRGGGPRASCQKRRRGEDFGDERCKGRVPSSCRFGASGYKAMLEGGTEGTFIRGRRRQSFHGSGARSQERKVCRAEVPCPRRPHGARAPALKTLPGKEGRAQRSSVLFPWSTMRVISEGTPRRQEKPFHRPVPGLT